MADEGRALARALCEAARVIAAGGPELDSTLDALVEQARLLLRAADVVINLRQAGGQLVRRRASRLVDPGSPYAATGVPAITGPLSREATESRRAVVVADYSLDPRVTDEARKAMPTIRTSLSVPLVANDAVLGIMEVRWTTPRAIEPDEVDVAEALGRHAAVAIRTAQIVEAMARHADRAERAEAVTAALAGALTAAEVGAIVVQQGAEAVGTKAGTLALCIDDGRGDEIEMVAATPGYPAAVRERWRRIPLAGPTPLATAVREARPIFLESPDEIEAAFPSVARELAAHGCGALAAIPLALGQRVLGALGLWFREPRAMTADERGWMVALAATGAQALDRARLYEQARRSDDRYRLAADAASLAVWDWDHASDRVAWSSPGLSVFGYPEGPTDVGWFNERIHPDDWERVRAAYSAVSGTRAERATYELRFQRADGSYAPCVVAARTTRDDDGRPVRTLGIVMDVTVQREAEAERDRLAEELARVAERQRLGMELHDGLVASLAGVGYMMEAAARTVREAPAEAAATLDRARVEVRRAVEEARAYASGLRGPSIDGPTTGLSAIAEHARAAGVAVELEVAPRAAELAALLPPQRSTDLVQVAREAVANALRHGAPTRLVLRLATDDGGLALTVRDDGGGFDPATIGSREGHGLGHMAERAERLGADLHVTSEHGAGAEIRLVLPLTQPTRRPKRTQPAD